MKTIKRIICRLAGCRIGVAYFTGPSTQLFCSRCGNTAPRMYYHHEQWSRQAPDVKR